MKNFDYEKKYHYLVKYFVIAFPLIFILLLTLIDSITFVDYSSYVGVLGQAFEYPINNWYFKLIDIMGFEGMFTDESIFSLLLVYPLYVFWVYVFDLILDVFAFVPKLAHKLMYKLGGN